MVFIGGPRQVGKTTLSLSLLGPNTKINSLAYLNWDSLVDREQILGQKIPSRQKIVVFDEIHKYARWRGLVKGLFDKNRNEVNFIVTGSARLDHFSKGGDSPQGRYHYYRLHPFSLGEISKHASKSDVDILFKLGGFPEPFLSGSEKDLRRWQMERNRRVLYEDLRDLETVKDVYLKYTKYIWQMMITVMNPLLVVYCHLKSFAMSLDLFKKALKRNLFHWSRVCKCGKATPAILNSHIFLEDP